MRRVKTVEFPAGVTVEMSDRGYGGEGEETVRDRKAKILAL